MEIYMLKVEWANDGETNGYVELYAKEETAKEKFQKAVQEAKADYDTISFLNGRQNPISCSNAFDSISR